MNPMENEKSTKQKRKKYGLSEEIREQLRAPLPPEAITQHPTKTFLSTIKAIYIVERLNDVFGLCGWTLATSIEKETDDYVLVSGFIAIPEFNLRTPLQYGGHKTTGTNTELADGYKSAVTDVQSKCASYLEVGLDVFKGKVKPNGQAKAPPKAPKPKVKPVNPEIIAEIKRKSRTVNNLEELQLLFENYPDLKDNAEYRETFVQLSKTIKTQKSNENDAI